MGAMIGLVMGYMLGTRDGEKGYKEVKEAWQVIRTSEEARYVVGQGISMAKNLLSQGSGMLSERLQNGSQGGAFSTLRPTG